MVSIIEKAANSTRPGVDQDLLKAIKSAIHCSNSELQHVAQTLMALMKGDHSSMIPRTFS